MKKSLFFQGLALLLCVCACSVEMETPVLTPTQLTFSATMGDSPTTKTHLSSDGKSPLWNAGDAINVFYGELSSGKFTSTSGNNVVSASFSGSLNVMSGTIEAGAGARKFFGVYPYADDNTCDGTSVTTTILSTQVSDAGSFATGMSPSVARSDNLDLAFYNICGGIAFSVKEAGITSITFTGNNDEAIAGKVKVGFDSNGKPVIEEVLSKATSVTVKPSTGTFKNDGTLYYALLLPQTYSQGLTFSFTKAGQRGQFVRTKSTTLARSVFGRLLNIDDGVEFIDDGTGGGEYDWSIIPADLVTVNNPTKGGLEDVLLEWGDYESITSLKVTGTMNDVDFLFIYNYMPNLRYLDIYEINNTVLPSKAFNKSSNVTHLILPESLTEIGESMFAMSKLEAVKITRNVRKIDKMAFNSCTLLSTVTFESGSILNEIAGGCYIGDRNIGESVNSDQYYGAFFSCSALKTIVIPASVETIGQSAFKKCTSLLSVSFEDGSQLKSIEGGYFHGSNSTWDPDRYMGAFSDCSSLLSIEIPASVGDYAFYRCNALKQVSFVNNPQLKTIGEHAFENIDVESIIVPASVETIGAYAFYDCFYLSSVLFESNSQLKRIDDSAFYYVALKSITIPANVEQIGSYAFGFDLSSVTFESGSHLKSIGAGAFSGDYTSITIPASVETIESGPSGTAGAFNSGSLSSVTFESGSQLKSLGGFRYTNISSIIVPASVETISADAFAGCSSLTTITFESNSQLKRIDDGAFDGVGLKSITIPATVEQIGGGAFCSKTLTNVVFESNSRLEELSSNVFNNCEKLSKISFKSNSALQTIQSGAFSGCNNLKTFDASGCPLLSSISCYFPSSFVLFYCGATTPPTLNSSPFSNISANAVLKVPDSCVDTYKNSAWNNYFSQISGFNE